LLALKRVSVFRATAKIAPTKESLNLDFT
jgi:hypothetical protein